MLHDTRSFHTYPPPVYPVYTLHYHTTDEISVMETIEELEGHRQPLFHIASHRPDTVVLTVVFTFPFQKEEAPLLEHLQQVLQEKLLPEKYMGQDD